MNYCPKCGSKLVEGTNFCPNCGLSLKFYLSQRDVQNDEAPEDREETFTQPQPEQPKFSAKIDNQLRHRLGALYNILISIFHIQIIQGNNLEKFSDLIPQLKLHLTDSELSILQNNIQPMLAKTHIATADDIDYVRNFVDELVAKYNRLGKKEPEEESVNITDDPISSVTESKENDDSISINSKVRDEKIDDYVDTNRPNQTNSQLLESLNNLAGQSSFAIADGEDLNTLQDYMHVERQGLEDDFLKAVKNLDNHHGRAIFLVGNVGDGKSHLLGYLQQKHLELFKEKNIKIHNDATESFDPKKSAMDTLIELMKPFSDSNIAENTQNVVIAINMGVLINFIRRAESEQGFTKVIQYLNKTGIVQSASKSVEINNDNFSLISFRNYPLFKVDHSGTNSTFYDALFEKVASPDENNPFYIAYENDKHKGINGMIQQNYKLFTNKNVRETLKFLLIKIQIESKVIVSTRSILELIHDIIVPPIIKKNDADYTYKDSLPFLLFGGYADSMIIESIRELDPLNFQSSRMEKLISKVYSSNKAVDQLITDTFENENSAKIQWIAKYETETDSDKKYAAKIQIIVRMMYLLQRNPSIFNDENYYRYLDLLEVILDGDMRTPKVREFYQDATEFILQWCGSPRENYVFTFVNPITKFGVAIPFDLEFVGIHEHDFNIELKLQNLDSQKTYQMVIDFELFNLISEVNNGYLLKEEDKHQFVNISTFIENIIKSDKALRETLIGYTDKDKYYRLTNNGLVVKIGE